MTVPAVDVLECRALTRRFEIVARRNLRLQPGRAGHAYGQQAQEILGSRRRTVGYFIELAVDDP